MKFYRCRGNACASIFPENLFDSLGGLSSLALKPLRTFRSNSCANVPGGTPPTLCVGTTRSGTPSRSLQMHQLGSCSHQLLNGGTCHLKLQARILLHPTSTQHPVSCRFFGPPTEFIVWHCKFRVKHAAARLTPNAYRQVLRTKDLLGRQDENSRPTVTHGSFNMHSETTLSNTEAALLGLLPTCNLAGV